MTDSELLIKIKTALEAGGIDAAKSKISELTQEVDKSGTSSAKTAAENQKTISTLNNLRMAANGNVAALSKLTGETTALGGALLKASAVAGAFMVGWQAGMKIGDFMWPKIFKLDEFDKTTGSIRDRARDAIKGLEEVNKVKMDELLKNLADVSTELADIFDKTEMTQNREKRVTEARQKTQMAEFESAWAGKEKGPQYERARAELEKKQADEMRKLEFDQIAQKESDIVGARNRLNEELKKVRAEEDAAKKKAAAATAAAAGGTPEDVVAAQVAEDEVKKATERRQATEENNQKEMKRLDRQMYGLGTERSVLGISSGATDASFRGSLASADRAAADAAAKVEKDALRKKLEAEDEARQKEIDAARSGVDPLSEAAASARDAASSYRGSAGLKGKVSARDRSAADARDAELEQIALQADARVAAFKQTIDALIKADKEKDAAAKRLLEERGDQISNLPL